MSDHTPIEDVADAVHDLAENAVQSTVVTSVKWFHRVEHVLELVLFTGRWLLAPLYLGLLGSLVVAEGVESEAQLAYLRTLHCDTYQGYLFSKPIDTLKLAALCAANLNRSDVQREEETG